MAQVELRGVSKAYPGGIKALTTVNLAIGDGELVTIVGPSGSGKSTLLRIVAGLEIASEGSVWIGDRQVDGLPPWRP